MGVKRQFSTVATYICLGENLQHKPDDDKPIYVATVENSLLPLLSSSLRRSVLLSGESGSSSWLTALPLSEHGFALHKGAFRDALCLQYGWLPPLLPSSCVCGKQFTVEHGC